MKRILLSFLISLVLVVGYLIASAIIVVVLSRSSENLNPSVVSVVDLPMRLPKLGYYRLFPPTIEDFSTNPWDIGPRRGLLGIGFFVANVLLYALPTYIVLSLISTRRRRHTAVIPNKIQPEPPVFPKS